MQLSTVPALPANATQTQIARAYMSPETNAVLPDRILDARIGRGTVAGGLNDTIRFRVRGTGASREFVPDSKLAVDLLATPAGPRLIQQLEAACETADWLPEKSNLKGFILPKGTDAVAAAGILSGLEPGGPPLAFPKMPTPRTPETISRLMRTEYADSREGSKSAGAWNSRGWITFMPDTARMMLTAAGAYRPDAKDPADARLRRAGRLAPYVATTTAHEVQHSLTSRKGRYENARWMEEGIANLFSETPKFAAELARKTGITPHSYAGRLAHEPDIDLGWGSWKRGTLPPKKRDEIDKEQQKRYVDSLPILRGLLRMAGAPLNTNAGVDKARALLQGDELDRVAGNLANAIIERNDLDRDSTYERLRQRIMRSIEDPRSLEKIAAEFGVKGP